MHVLAVSPEKRGLLVEQLRMKRQFTTAASTVVPPAAADLAIFRGIDAVDAELAGGNRSDDDAVAPLPMQGAGVPWRQLVVAIGTIVLLLGAFGAGYLYRGGDVTVAT